MRYLSTELVTALKTKMQVLATFCGQHTQSQQSMMRNKGNSVQSKQQVWPARPAANDQRQTGRWRPVFADQTQCLPCAL